MISAPPDGRHIHGQKIEGLVHGLDTLVTEYLNMLSLADKAKGEQKVLDTFLAHSVLVRVLKLDA